MVGSNASGKSRTLNVINGLAKLLAGDTKVNILSGGWNVTFENEGKSLVYALQIADLKVVKEEFTVDGTELLKRGAGGIGKLWAKQLDNYIEFQVPEDQLAAVARLDSIQHPFFEPLHAWANLFITIFLVVLSGKTFSVLLIQTRKSMWTQWTQLKLSGFTEKEKMILEIHLKRQSKLTWRKLDI